MKKTFLSCIKDFDVWRAVLLSIKNGSISVLKTDEDETFESLISRFKNHHYIISLNSSEGYLLKLDFPFGGRKKIAAVIKGELESLLPLSIDNVQYDFIELESQGNILALACNKTVLTTFTSDKNLKSITLNAFAAFFYFYKVKAFKKKNFIFAFIEHDTLTLFAFNTVRLVALRQIIINNNMSIIQSAIADICTILHYKPDALYLAGLDVDIQSGVPFDVLVERLSLTKYINVDNAFLPAIGAAYMLSDFDKAPNLLKPLSTTDFLSSNVFTFFNAGLVAVSALIVIYFHLELYFYENLSKYLSSEQQRVYKSVFPKSPAIKDVSAALQNKINSLQGVNISEYTSSVTVLAEISRLIDEKADVRLTDFTYSNGEIVFNGNTISYTAVENIKSDLMKSKIFKYVEIIDMDFVGTNQVKFKMKIGI